MMLGLGAHSRCLWMALSLSFLAAREHETGWCWPQADACVCVCVLEPQTIALGDWPTKGPASHANLLPARAHGSPLLFLGRLVVSSTRKSSLIIFQQTQAVSLVLGLSLISAALTALQAAAR